jgi:hypothetical protein
MITLACYPGKELRESQSQGLRHIRPDRRIEVVEHPLSRVRVSSASLYCLLSDRSPVECLYLQSGSDEAAQKG